MSKETKTNVTGKHRHRSPIDINNPQKASKEDWWDELCKKHGEENLFPKDKKKSK